MRLLNPQKSATEVENSVTLAPGSWSAWKQDLCSLELWKDMILRWGRVRPEECFTPLEPLIQNTRVGLASKYQRLASKQQKSILTAVEIRKFTLKALKNLLSCKSLLSMHRWWPYTPWKGLASSWTPLYGTNPLSLHDLITSQRPPTTTTSPNIIILSVRTST